MEKVNVDLSGNMQNHISSSVELQLDVLHVPWTVNCAELSLLDGLLLATVHV